jgi:microcystin-dependent protein
LLAIQSNTALYSILGTTYGGDGVTTFGLPNVPPLGQEGPYYLIAVHGLYPSRG